MGDKSIATRTIYVGTEVTLEHVSIPSDIVRVLIFRLEDFLNLIHCSSIQKLSFYFNDDRCYYCIVLYFSDAVVIAAQCTANFLRSILLPELRYY